MPAKVILLVGEQKTGKTVSACTFPKPLAFLDLDSDGAISIDNAKTAQGQLVISPSERAQIKIVPFLKEKSYDLDLGSPFKQKSAPAHVSEAPGLLNLFNKTIKGLRAGTGIDNDGVKYRTVVIDPLTVFFRLWKEALLFLNNQSVLQIQDYMTMETVLFGQFIPTIKALPADYVIVVDHTDMEKDEITGTVMEFPIGPSKMMGRNMGQAFPETWRQREEGGKFVWRTRKTGLFQAGSRHHLPDPVEANYRAVKSYLESTSVSPTVENPTVVK